MKNKIFKRVFIALFIVCGLIAAFAITSSALTEIKSVTVNGVIEPSPNENPKFVYYYNDSDKVTIKFDSWYDVASGQYMTSSSKFVGGNQYMCTFTVTPRTGYKLSPSLIGTINGNGCTVDTSGTSWYLKLIFTCPKTIIKSVNLTIQTPSVGSKPDYDPKTTTAGVGIYNHSDYCTVWQPDGTTNEYTSSSSYVIQPNRTYTVKVYIFATSSYYKFADVSQLTASINGKTAAVTDMGKGLYCVSCSFKPEKGKITSVYVKDIVFPAENTKISTGCSISTENSYIGSSSDAVKWTRNGSALNITSSNTYYFTSGYEYRLILKIMPSDGYAFDFDNLSARFYKSGSGSTYVVPEIQKGVQTQAGYNSEGLTLSYTFPKLNVTITEINLSGITVPSEGARPDMSTPKIAQDGAVIYGTRWRLSDGSNSKDLNANSVFEAGKSYSYIVYLEPGDGYTFEAASKMTATLNGKSAEISSISGAEYKRAVIYNFYVESAPVNTVALTVTEPSLGAKPAATASTDGGKYIVASVSWEPYDSTFAANNAYSVIISLETINGAVFANPMSSVRINNKTAKVISGAGTEQLKISYTFPALKSKEITSVNITGIDVPVTGAAPDVRCLTNTVGLTIESVSWYEPHYAFEAGKAYTVSVYLQADSGYAFADTVSATINGNSAEYYVDSYGNHIVAYTFPATDVPKTAKPVITEQPKGGTYKFGETPDMMSVTVKLNDCDAKLFQWYMTSVNDISTIKAIYDEEDDSYGTQSFFVPEQIEGTTYYCVMVTNCTVIDGKVVSSESVYSELVSVTFYKEIGIPSVITSPESVTAKLGETVKLSTFIKPIGEGELHIQWYRSSEYNMNGATPIIGAEGVELIPEQTLGTVYYRAAAYMEYNGMRSKTVYTKTASVTYETDEVTVEGIEILNMPAKLEYISGEKLDTNGMVLRVVMSDGYKNITEGFTCSPTLLNAVGTQKITVTYEGKTTVFEVSVKDSHTHKAGSEWKSDSSSHWNLCSCGQKMNEDAHQFGEWKVVKNATDTEGATKERVCSVCGYKETVVDDIPDAPVTDAPVTDAPVTDAPVTDTPVTDAPVTDAPVTDAPVTDAPATDTPSTDSSSSGEAVTDPQNSGDSSDPDTEPGAATGGNSGQNDDGNGFPLWIVIVVLAGVLVIMIVVVIILSAGRKNKKA